MASNQSNTNNNSSNNPPWAWIKCIRDLTDPIKNRHNEENVELPVELLPWLLLSDRKSALNINKLKNCRITHILSVHAVAPREELYYQDRLEGTGIIHKRVSCDDTEGYDMIGRHWKTCLEFLKQVKNNNGRVVVHCVAGINRSGLIACAAHMVLEQLPLVEVVQHCLQKRGACLWNRSFQNQLCELAQREGLLGPKPEGYNDEPLIDKLPPPPPAHFAIGMEAAKLRLASQLGSQNNDHNKEEGNTRDIPRKNQQTPAQTKMSKALSWALRHQGPNIGLTMTPDGYVPVAQIIKSQHPRFRGENWTVENIQEIVACSDKQRYQLAWRPAANYPNAPIEEDAIKEDATVLCIRASQGHSLDFIDPELLLTPISKEKLAKIPMMVHGTDQQAWEIIRTAGLNRRNRNHIHFAPGLPEEEEEVISGMRKSCTVYIYVDVVKCANHPDIDFYQSTNGVLLTAGVRETGTLPVAFFSHVTDSTGTILLDQR